MAVIVPTYSYVDGAVFDATSHNVNIYSETAAASILGEANGNLDINNFDPTFQVRDYHIRPEEAVRVRSDYARDSIDYFSEAESGPDVAEDAVREELVDVAGCGMRFWIPYASVVTVNMGFFVNIFRLHLGSNTDQESTTNIDFGDVRLQLSIGSGGSAPVVIQETKRGLPVSAQLNPSSTYGLENWEEVGSFYIDLHHTSRASFGWYDVHLRMLLSEASDDVNYNVLRNFPQAVATARPYTGQHRIHTRVSFGIRHPVALVLKSS